MTTIEIKKPEEHLYHRFYNQSKAQDTFLEFDPEQGKLWANYNPEVGNCVPGAVFHGIIRRYPLWSPALSATAIGYLMDKVAPLCKRVAEGFESEWNGSNHVGILDFDAQEAEEEIAKILGEVPDCSDYITVEDAGDWLDDCREEIEEDVACAKQNDTDEDASDIVQRYIDEGNDIDVVDDVDHFVDSVEAAAGCLEMFCYVIEDRGQVVEAFWAPSFDAAKRHVDRHIFQPEGTSIATIDVGQLEEDGWSCPQLPKEGTLLVVDCDGQARIVNEAEYISAMFGDDGQVWHVGDLELVEVCKERCVCREKEDDREKYTFNDDSSIITTEGGWDLGFVGSGCLCWNYGCGHEDDCPDKRYPICPECQADILPPMGRCPDCGLKFD